MIDQQHTALEGRPARVGSPPRLNAAHLAKLASSAIPMAIQRERGYRTVDDRDPTMAHLAPSQQLAGLASPIYRLGRPYTTITRPDAPRTNLKGKPIKYDWTAGLPMVLDCLPRYIPQLADPTIPIWITEGPLKADALTGLGERIVVIDLFGVWCWKHKNADGESVPLADFERVALKGRRVVVCFDSDQAVNTNVQQARDGLIAFLESRGAIVGNCRLPHGAAKLGVDDAIAAGWTYEQLEAAIRWRPPSGDDQAAAPPFRIYRGDAIDQVTAPRQLVKGYLAIGAVALLIGPSEAGKSTLAVDIACKVAQHYGVLYVAGEDGGNVRSQIRAWELLHNKPRSPNLALVDGPVLLSDDMQVATFISAAREMAPRLIVIDTLSSCIPGVDENSSDVGHVTYNLNRIADELGASVLVLHHPLKYDGETFRGHSSLNNNTHTMLVASRDEGDDTVSLKVIRHKGPRAAPATLRLIVRQTDIVDPDDGVLSAPVAVPANRVILDDNHLSTRQQAILQFLADVDADGGATNSEIQKEMALRFKVSEASIRAKDISSLTRRGFINKNDDGKRNFPRRLLPKGYARIATDHTDHTDHNEASDPFVINARLDEITTIADLVIPDEEPTIPQQHHGSTNSDPCDPLRSACDPTPTDHLPDPSLISDPCDPVFSTGSQGSLIEAGAPRAEDQTLSRPPGVDWTEDLPADLPASPFAMELIARQKAHQRE